MIYNLALYTLMILFRVQVPNSTAEVSSLWLHVDGMEMGEYFHFTNCGTPRVAVIDTGCPVSMQVSPDTDEMDHVGHGSCMASIIGNNAVCIKVTDSQMRISDHNVLIAFNVLRQTRPPYASMSLSRGVGRSRIMDAAAEMVNAANVTIVRAAGNKPIDVCNTSPRSSRTLIIGAASRYKITPYSGHGKCVDYIVDVDNVFCRVGLQNQRTAGTSPATAIFARELSSGVVSYFYTNDAYKHLNRSPMREN